MVKSGTATCTSCFGGTLADGSILKSLQVDTAKCAKITDMFAIATRSSTAAAGAGPEKEGELATEVDLEEEE